MSVCSLTEVSVQADSLITPLHHTTLLSYCRFSTDEGFLCVCVCLCVRKEWQSAHLLCNWTCVFILLHMRGVYVCATSQVPPLSCQAWTESITWVECRRLFVCVCVWVGFTCMFIYQSPAYLPLPSRPLTRTHLTRSETQRERATVICLRLLLSHI